MTQIEQKEIYVTAICGSLREKSYTRLALNIALKGAEQIGVKTKLIDLRDYDLGFCDGRSDTSTYPPDVHKLKAEIKGSHGIIIGTPEYHASFSGVLKNALDFMSFEELEGKMIGLVGVSGGVMGATNALNSLRNIGRQLHAWVIPQQTSIPSVYNKFDKDKNLIDKQIEERLILVGQQVARFSSLHNSEQAQEFLQAWEGAPFNPGGKK